MHLLNHQALASAKLDGISPEILTGFVENRRRSGYEVSSINRALQVLRRMLRLALEWGTVEKISLKVSLLPGERRRERVLSLAEEIAYLNATDCIADLAI